MVSKTEKDFKSDREALIRIRLKGFLNVLSRGRAIHSGDKRFWTIMSDAVDVIYGGLEPVLKAKWCDSSPVALSDKTVKVLNELTACLTGSSIIGFSQLSVLGSPPTRWT